MLYTLWVLLTSLGPRISEALAVKWSDIDFARGTIAITTQVQRQTGKGVVRKRLKTKLSRRTLKMPARLIYALE